MESDHAIVERDFSFGILVRFLCGSFDCPFQSVIGIVISISDEDCDIEKGAQGPPGPPGLQGEIGQKGEKVIQSSICFM